LVLPMVLRGAQRFSQIPLVSDVAAAEDADCDPEILHSKLRRDLR